MKVYILSKNKFTMNGPYCFYNFNSIDNKIESYINMNIIYLNLK